MNTLHGHPEVTTFVDLVRLFLGDLDDETRDELTGGLEADLVDLVAERGIDALPDPEAYADELRAAAGLHVPPRLRRPGVVSWSGVSLLDIARERFLAWAGGGRHTALWEGLVTLRPVWWVVRAWVAVQLADLLFGDSPHGLLPQLGPGWLGALVLGGAVAASVQAGRARWWPGGHDPHGGRLLLVAANVTLVCATVPITSAVIHDTDHVAYLDGYEDGYVGGREDVGDETRRRLRLDNQRICAVTVLDAAGVPLDGVQLVDQRGREIPLDDDRC